MESILGLLKSLNIRALDFAFFVNSVPGTALKESRGRSVEVRELLKDQEKESAGGWEFTEHSTVQRMGVRMCKQRRLYKSPRDHQTKPKRTKVSVSKTGLLL